MGNGTGERYDQCNGIILGFRSYSGKDKEVMRIHHLVLNTHFFSLSKAVDHLCVSPICNKYGKTGFFFIIFRIRLDTVVDATTLGWHCVVTFILHNQTMQSGKALKKKNNSKDINIIFFLSAGKHLTGVTLYE